MKMSTTTTKREGNIFTEALGRKISRRSFVKWSSALGATATLSGLIVQSGLKVASAYNENGATAASGGTVVKWRPTCCLVCHSWCALAVGVDANGHVRKIEGQGGQPRRYATVGGLEDGGSNIKPWPVTGCSVVTGGADYIANPTGLQAKPDDREHIPTPDGILPYAMHNKGRICAKGNDGMEHLYDPDRIKYPLKRTGERGAGYWKKVSWSDALGEIADVLRGLGNRVDGDGSPNDKRHRFVYFIGRNENGFPGRFASSYGTPNRIEHTSICEVSRHVAGHSLWGHHWSSVDVCTHTDGHNIVMPSYGTSIGGSYMLHDDNDIDCYIEWGGNPAEAKIPHATWATHLGDRRRKNLKGYTYTADAPAGRPLAARKGRIIAIDVRQSNTCAFADEEILITPGTDGALALAMIRYLMDTLGDDLRRSIDRGHEGPKSNHLAFDDVGQSDEGNGTRLYFGIFKSEEATGTVPVPLNESLETYLTATKGTTLHGTVNSTFADHVAAPTAGLSDVMTTVAALTGLTVTDIVYLARATAGLPCKLISGTPLGGTWGGNRFANVVNDGYRGPCKHSNGAYNYRAIRTLQWLAANESACHFATGRAAPKDARGGFNAAGGFISDGNWDPWHSYATPGEPQGDGGGDFGGFTGKGNTDTTPATLPDGQSIYPSSVSSHSPTSKYQRVDDWDYDRDVPRYRGSWKWVDQNTSPGIRQSVGLDPFTVGVTNFGPGDVHDGPYRYTRWTTSTPFDPTYRVEALLIHKNAPAYARANVAADRELFTAKDPTDPYGKRYLLNHFWSIDIAMGDGTRYADIILPEVSYLERWANRGGEGQEMSWRDDTFNRIPVYETTIASITGADGDAPRHMYDSKQITAIMYELARKIEPGNTVGTKVAPWNGALYNSFNWVPPNATTVAGSTDEANDGEYAVRSYYKQAMNNGSYTAAATAAGSASDGLDYGKSHGYLWNSDNTPSYWRGKYLKAADGDSGEMYSTTTPHVGFKPYSLREKFTVHNTKLGSMPDIVNSASTNVPTAQTKTDGNFWPIPVYRPVLQHSAAAEALIGPGPGATLSGPLYLTTYKLNVHTQSRTANLPRLTEIIGQSWVVIHPDTATPLSINNGDKVVVVTELGELVGEAKVTPKAGKNCVHISHSLGHALESFGGDGFGGTSGYKVSEDGGVTHGPNRSKSTLIGPDGAATPGLSGIIDSYTLNLPPSAPGRGIHPNNVINLHNAIDPGDGVVGELATDALGCSMCWFDSRCKIGKL